MRPRLAYCAAALIVLACVVAGNAQARPNVLLVLTDDQRWDTVSAMPLVTSHLVDRGVTFSNAFVVDPLCCPSRASILTGKHSHSHQIYRNVPPFGGFASFRDRTTIATSLRKAGYRTGYFGKYLNGYVNNAYVPPGWSRWVGFSPPGYNTYALNIDGVLQSNRDWGYSTDFLAEETAAFVEGAQEPFFAVFAPFAPHQRAIPADRHAGAFPNLEPSRPPSYDEANVSDKPAYVRAHAAINEERRAAIDNFRANQLRTLLAVDEGVDRIVRALADAGRLDDTIIVYTSDNGYLWGEHRLTDKRYPYEESIRVPFIVRYDPLTSAARVEPRPVLNIDLAPTFAALAGTSIPGAEGQSIVPLLGASEAPWRTRFLVEAMKDTLGSKIEMPSYCALRTPQYTYVTYGTGERELYDLINDRPQLQNVARNPSWSSVATLLRTRLARLCNPPPPGLSRSLLCTHVGTGAGDVLTGSRRYDIVCARAGHDVIDPRGATDYVFAGSGNDRIYARDGRRDHVACGEGFDILFADLLDPPGSACEQVRRP